MKEFMKKVHRNKVSNRDKRKIFVQNYQNLPLQKMV